MEIRYQFIEKDNLHIQKYIGDFSIEHYLSFMKMIVTNKQWKNIDKVLTDLVDTDLQKAYESLDSLIKFRINNISQKYYNVFLVANPQTTAITHLYQKRLKNNKLAYDYCSTIEHAIDLLELDYSIIEMNMKINSLENRY